ncbi:DEAD/DEAH box helicase [Paucibacter sp. B2R-40]|uniref:DEAD/DEAH box helicase n=1 Tax=Paucibacter sp. B2R-40 TaxID=2893554 RepID=UPI0021E499BC|nr:DEAD/DEAH box helicase [Paucibacter sp. B2R-40]MCV2352563.1 DEAD/DEAH box helicase [Paucibacter sp. B2R-40]
MAKKTPPLDLDSQLASLAALSKLSALGGLSSQNKDELLAKARQVKADMMSSKPAPNGGAKTAAPPPLHADDEQQVFDALLLSGGTRGAQGVQQWLQASGAVDRARGLPFELSQTTQCLQSLLRRGLVEQLPGHGFVLDPREHSDRLQILLLREESPQLPSYWRRLAWVLGGGYGDVRREIGWISFRSRAEMLAMLRLYIFSGVSRADFEKSLKGPLMELHGDPMLLLDALTQPWMPLMLDRMAADLRAGLLGQAMSLLATTDPRAQLMSRWLEGRFKAEPLSVAPGLRAQLAEARVQALDFAGMRDLLQGLSGPSMAMFDGAELAARGEWAPAVIAFEAAIKDIRKATGARRDALDPDMARIYVMCLLAQDDPKAWTAARKFCIGESGSRSPSAYEGWGRWAHVIGTRLGEDSLDENCLAYLPALESREHSLGPAAERVLLAAWAGKPAPGWEAPALQALLQRLQSNGQLWLASWLAAAAERLEMGPIALNLQGQKAPASFLTAPREAWRDALAAITSLGDEKAITKPAGSTTELAWQLTLDAQGRVQDVEPLERSVSARGVAKLKPITLTKLKKSGAADARDNAVLRHIERSPYGGINSFQIDGPQAAVALIGHPALMFADAPGQWVELVEAQPELEVLKRPRKDASGQDTGEEQFEFRIHPALVGVEPPRLFGYFGSNHEAESARRDSLRILRDGPQRARLIRISNAQRRVAELVAQGWAVPISATAELGAALQVLSGLFQLHSDAEAGQMVAGDSRLHARLFPLGDGLQLQLVAQPFGGFGPAVTPGQGRARLMCMHEGVSLATERDLAAEHAARLTVLDALPFLDPELGPESPWMLADAEEALRAVEVLPGLPGIAALDWPKGKPLRVTPVASQSLTVQVSSGRDWLGLNGEAQLDEGRVIGLQELLTLARASRSRFVRLGEGEYLALSEQLRQQLRDLDALGQLKKDQLQLPHAVASWLDETLVDMEVDGDKSWHVRMDALAGAAALQPALPPGLRAELRSYQMEGFAWMTRLARAGLGACLADDMGLGKTVQTLALLIDRAELGPALVLAPTSVCGNWLEEAATFAPGLGATVYGEDADRAGLIAAAGPGDVLVVSYALAQIDGDLFANKQWATLVMDEAQALKNAATKRAKSVAEFKADFRLALSGTPVENRLADLWSIMNLINPGLLGSAAQFSERFATPIEKHQDAPARQRLRRLVSPFLLRRTKTQVLQDLPARTEIVHLVQPSSEEKSFLEALRRSAQDAVASAAKNGQAAPMQVLAELMRLRRAACDPRLVAPELGLVGSKLGEFERIVRELVDGSHKALVFSQFTDFLKILAERLDSMGVKYQYLDGSTPAAERTKRVAAFQRGEGEVFLISLKAGGFGLNLTMADYVLIVDPWWNPAAEDQATGRAHRMGQKRPVTVYRLVTAGSVEERIIDLHRDKRGLADGILEGQEEATVLDAQALAALLRG